MSGWNDSDLRAIRRTGALVVETAELRAQISRLMDDGEMVTQMSRLLADGAAEYERAVLALRQIERAPRLDKAKKIAQDYLRSIA